MIEKTKEHNGVTYNNIRFSDKTNVAATACVGDKRIVLKGFPKFTITKGSYKFGDEIQFSISNFKGAGIISDRNPSDWDTIELCMPKEVGKLLVDQLQSELKKEEKE